ncbi:pilus assembly protein [Vibrio sp. RE86]|uniref:TadE family protein n=1 Tax=Vibrio sp. RE86 TaxID=2607605 RepID=UPI001493BD1D|nr:TadE family protein [Vibrio sp. RE86]NOH79637.1 pilus assembly protein [Vibrio sp. RE86]
MKKFNTGLISVELTILTPLIMLMLYIAVDFGRVMSEIIVTSSSASSAAGHGSIHSGEFDSPIDSAGMLAIAQKDAEGLSINENEVGAVSVTTERVCRCYDPNGGALVEPTTSACATNCSDQKEVYIQTTVTRNFNTLSGHEAMPNLMTLNSSARYRVE